MTLFYSQSAHGFFDDEINKTIPADAISLTKEEYDSLFAGLRTGTKEISVSGNQVTLVNIPVDTAKLSQAIREKRNILLAQSDWTEIPNSPLSDAKKQAWSTYRQALRDLPEHSDFPNTPFPTSPV